MGKVNCAVIGCSNSSYQVNKWKGKICNFHDGVKRGMCGCDPPYKQYCFPSELRNSQRRQAWMKLLRREGKNKTNWKPCGSDRVCSNHFVDSIPTPANPDPTINMGYEQTTRKQASRRELFRRPLTLNLKPVTTGTSDEDIPSSSEAASTSPLLSPVLSDHSYIKTPNSQVCCHTCSDKSNLIESLVDKINMLNLKIKRGNRVNMFNSVKSSVFTWRKIKTDLKMNFYTGISSINLFNVIFLLLSPFLQHVRYWRGSSRARCLSKFRRTYTRCAPKILTHRDEFLLTLMRLRLGLLNEDLADRFGISATICSNTFTTWIKILSNVLSDALVVWLPRESIRDNLPTSFVKTGHRNCRVILDCAEVFIERPKSLLNQAITWSDYKHHNTLKFLIGIAPSGYITFLSDCYGGRATDKFITNDSAFYELLERDDEVMVDRGFQIREELLFKYCTLSIPPGARVKSQMTEMECKKTKEVANLRIHVERAINRIKFYRILKATLPITMIHHTDDIVRSCAALCNLKPCLIN